MSKISIEEQEKLFVRHLADLSVVLHRQNPRPGSIRLMLRLAKEDGLDWRNLYQKAVRTRDRMPWFTDPEPSMDEVNPEIPDGQEVQ